MPNLNCGGFYQELADIALVIARDLQSELLMKPIRIGTICVVGPSLGCGSPLIIRIAASRENQKASASAGGDCQLQSDANRFH